MWSRRFSPTGLLVVVALLCAGCAGTSDAGSTDFGAGGQTGATTTAPALRHHRRVHPHHATRLRQRRRPAVRPRATTGLPASTTDPSSVQPQPPPGSCHARGSGDFSLPDPHCTPGAIDPAVTQSNIGSTICVSGYTRGVRPSESVTEPEKEASLLAYGDSAPLGDYEYDHLVPLELGGARNDPRNLWPEPGGVPNPKDELEYRLRTMVCAGEMQLAAAQLLIARDWVAAYHRYVG